MILPSAIAGVLLAGGQSRRMGGGDKGLLTIAGRPMIAHVIECLRPQVGGMAINANGDPARFAAFELPVVADTISGFAGPLAGVLAGMRWALAHAAGATHLATVSADAPFVPRDLIGRLVEGLERAPIVLAASGGEVHPVIGVWPVALADDLEAALMGGERRVSAWALRHGATVVEFGFERVGERLVDPFFNANTPDDLDEARRLMAIRLGSRDGMA